MSSRPEHPSGASMDETVDAPEEERGAVLFGATTIVYRVVRSNRRPRPNPHA